MVPTVVPHRIATGNQSLVAWQRNDVMATSSAWWWKKLRASWRMGPGWGSVLTEEWGIQPLMAEWVKGWQPSKRGMHQGGPKPWLSSPACIQMSLPRPSEYSSAQGAIGTGDTASTTVMAPAKPLARLFIGGMVTATTSSYNTSHLFVWELLQIARNQTAVGLHKNYYSISAATHVLLRLYQASYMFGKGHLKAMDLFFCWRQNSTAITKMSHDNHLPFCTF